MEKWLKKMAISSLIGVFVLGYSFQASAQVTLDDLLKRVEAVEKKNADLQQENDALKAQIQSIQQVQVTSSVIASPSVVAPTAPIASEGNPVTSKLKLKVYGFVQVENVYATGGSTTGSSTVYNNVISYTAPHFTGAGKPQRMDKVSAQNSRLGIAITGPDLKAGKTSGKLELDFNNPSASSSAETYQPRLRF